MLSRHFRLFLSLVAASMLLMTYQSRTGPLGLFRFLSYSLNNVNAFIESLGDGAGETLRKVALDDAELKRLRKEVRGLRLDALMHRKVLIENARFREALALKESEPRHVATARVVSRGGGRWSNTFVIDKGGDDLVEKDMAAITPEGLLGKVIETQASFSKILLIDDSLFSVAVRLEDERAEGVLSGEGRELCRLKYIGVDAEVARGDVLVTSGLDGLFPPDIPVGYVSKVSTREKDLFHDIEAVPFVDSGRVEEVAIISR